MSSELDDVARSLFIGSIPYIWRKLAPATLKSLGNWMVYFLRRFSQYTGWVRPPCGTPGPTTSSLPPPPSPTAGSHLSPFHPVSPSLSLCRQASALGLPC